MNKVKFFFLIYIIFVLISCSNSSVKLNINKKNNENKNVQDKDTDSVDHLDYNIAIDEFVYLFFDKSFFVKKRNNTKISSPSRNRVSVDKPDEYKAIVDWREKDGGRYVRLRNITTGQEYIVKQGNTTGEIIMLERNLFFYKFKIGNKIIKVKR